MTNPDRPPNSAFSGESTDTPRKSLDATQSPPVAHELAPLNPAEPPTGTGEVRRQPFDLLTPIGAVLAGLGFLLPYAKSPTLFGRSIAIAGIDIARVATWIWLIPLSAIAILVTCFTARAARPPIPLNRRFHGVASFVGLGTLAYGLKTLNEKGGLLNMSASDFGVSLGVGVWVSAAGFLIIAFDALTAPAESAQPRGSIPGAPAAASGVLRSIAVRPLISDEMAARAASSAGELLHSVGDAAMHGRSAATATARQLGKRMRASDILRPLRRRAPVIVGVFMAIAVGSAAYVLFLRPDPEADGRKVAREYTQCESKYASSAVKGYDIVLHELTRRRYASRAVAVHALDSVLGPARSAYNNCMTEARARYESVRIKYATDIDRFQRFDIAFQGDGIRDRSVNEIDLGGPSQAMFTARIATLRAPAPDGNRIIADLIGKRIDGWIFAFASEFDRVSILFSEMAGDSLVLRADLRMHDYRTGSPFRGLVDLHYALDQSGNWGFDDVRELVFSNDTTASYAIGGRPFLLGRWRWVTEGQTGRFIEFKNDGTYDGSEDSGRQIGGRWRIVNSFLKLTENDGAASEQSRITQFSASSLTLGEMPPFTRAERVP